MKRIRHLFLATALTACCLGIEAAPVKVTMNTLSPTMSLARKGNAEPIATGAPAGNMYNLDLEPGVYVLTALATDGTTSNGTIELNVAEGDNSFSILTCTAYVTNKNADGQVWTLANGDFDLDLRVMSKEGMDRNATYGQSITAGRNTFLAMNGDSYVAFFNSSPAHAAEGFGNLFKTGTLTTNATVYGAIPTTTEFTVSAPADALMQLGFKTTHFVDFRQVAPIRTQAKGSSTEYIYRLNVGQQYNYRTMRAGGVTLAGLFTANADASKNPVLTFSERDYASLDPAIVNHTASANDGYETGDILVNINEKGYKRMATGEKFNAHAMRNWELTSTVTGNYFIEPDFHYTIIGLDGKPADNILKVEVEPGSSWATISAVGKGTAIVLVTYDAIKVNSWNGTAKEGFVGGDEWGAIWPENTAAYVISVDEGEAAVTPGFYINPGKNASSIKNSGDNVDSELDVFYFPDTEEGYSYNFTATGASSVTVAYPTIGDRMATYSGFGENGITRNDDGSYNVLLKEGRQIIRMTDAGGNSTYQVLTARPCRQEISNASRPGAKRFLPGEKVKVQYSGLYHPANKLAGIYNFTAAVSLNGTTCDSPVQYTFASDAAAQAIELVIPSNLDTQSDPEFKIEGGAIFVTNFGDPLGNHRLIGRETGRSANFTAIMQNACMGHLPDAAISVSAIPYFNISVHSNVSGASVILKYNGTVLNPDSETGLYKGSWGTYTVEASKDGYRRFRAQYSIDEGAEGVQTFNMAMEELNGAWDGKTTREPALNADNMYEISNGEELAWFAQNVNSAGTNQKAVVTGDIHLGNFDWTPIGTSTKPFTGSFNGNGHEIAGLYINTNGANQGLFGYAKGAAASTRALISGILLRGEVKGGNSAAGILAYSHNYVDVDRCANYADVTSTSTGAKFGAAGIIGTMYYNTASVTNCYNAGTITCTTNHGGIVGYLPANVASIENVYNIGEIVGETKANACFGNATATLKCSSAYALKHASANTLGYTLVSQAEMQSGKVAYLLGSAFGQTIGVDPYPVLGGRAVYYDEATDTYRNDNATGVVNPEESEIRITGYYNLQGEHSRHPWKGVNIVRYSDGSTRKIMVF